MATPIIAEQAHVDPQLMFLASAMKCQLRNDDAGQRAVDRAVEHLASGLAYEFDGVELRITSASRRGSGQIQVTDGLQAAVYADGHGRSPDAALQDRGAARAGGGVPARLLPRHVRSLRRGWGADMVGILIFVAAIVAVFVLVELVGRWDDRRPGKGE